jgi:short-subunit dehydrogenase
MTKEVIVITGSTRGIGHGLALEFLKRGHQLVINGRNEQTVEQCVKELLDLGYSVLGVPGDVTKEHTFHTIVDRAMDRYGKIDIWINNAGIPQSHKLFYELESQEIERLISVNVSGLMVGTQVAIKFFKKQGHGLVLNMEGFGSDGRIMKKLSLYGTSKRAVQYFSKSVSRELGEENIRVGIISPGMVKTDFLKESMSKGDTAEQQRTRKVLDILAEDLDVVTAFLVKKILLSKKQYDRIEYLTFFRLFPKLLRLMFVR